MYSEELIQKTRETFEPRYGRELTRYEAEDILNNLSAFASILLEWHQKDVRNSRTKTKD